MELRDTIWLPWGLRVFSDNSVGKESACSAGDPRLIPGLGRSPGEGKGYPLQYSGLENSTLQHLLHGRERPHDAISFRGS